MWPRVFARGRPPGPDVTFVVLLLATEFFLTRLLPPDVPLVLSRRLAFGLVGLF